MKKIAKIVSIIIALALLLSVYASAETLKQSNAFYVADYADVLTDATEKYIVDQNKLLFQACGGEIVVATVNFIDGKDIEQYAYSVFNEWQIGSSEFNNGLLILLVIGEENYWAVQGSGLEKTLTASLIAEYLNTYLEPDFKEKSYDAGVNKVFDAFLGWYSRNYSVSLGGSTATPTPNPSQGVNPPANNPSQGGALDTGTARNFAYSAGRFVGVLVLVILLIFIFIAILVAIPRGRHMRRRGYYYGPFGYFRPAFWGYGHRHPRYHQRFYRGSGYPPGPGHRPGPGVGPRPSAPPPRPSTPPRPNNFTTGGGYTRGGGAGRSSGGGFGGGAGRPGGGFSGGGRSGGGGFSGGGGRSGGGGGSTRGGGAGRR